MKGLKETALQAKHTGGHPPLGYDISEEKLYIVNDIDAEAIKIIFDRFDQGYSYRAILEELNARGFKTRNGNSFGINSLYDILRNRKYTGCYIFNLKDGKDALGQRNNHRLKDPEHTVIIPNAFPAIISDDLFDRVQKRMDDRRKEHSQGSQKAKVVYLLSGRLYCNQCGNKMTGTSSSYKTRVSKELRRRHQYECSFAKRTHKCDTKKIAKEKIESIVLSELTEGLFNDINIRKVAKDIFSYQRELLDNNSAETEKQKTNQQIKTLDGAIENLVTAITIGGTQLPSLVERLRVLENQREILQQKIGELSVIPSSQVSEESIIEYLQEHKEKVLEQDPMLRKQVVELFVEKVTISKSTATIGFTVPVVSNGGGGGSRTPVRKKGQLSLSERSSCFEFRSADALRTGFFELSPINFPGVC
jgi:site-specific DNA recombinase